MIKITTIYLHVLVVTLFIVLIDGKKINIQVFVYNAYYINDCEFINSINE